MKLDIEEFPFLKIFSEIQPHPNGTTFLWFSPINVLQAVTNKKLLLTEVPFHTSKSVTYYALRATRNNEIKEENLSSQISRSFYRTNQTECNSVLGLSPYDSQRIRFMKKIWSSFIEAQQEISQTLENSKYKVSWIEQSSRVVFEKGDVANDCFHPSIQGQERLARELYPEVYKFFIPDPQGRCIQKGLLRSV